MILFSSPRFVLPVIEQTKIRAVSQLLCIAEDKKYFSRKTVVVVM